LAPPAADLGKLSEFCLFVFVFFFSFFGALLFVLSFKVFVLIDATAAANFIGLSSPETSGLWFF